MIASSVCSGRSAAIALMRLSMLAALRTFVGGNHAVAVVIEAFEHLVWTRQEFFARDVAVIVGVGARELMHSAAAMTATAAAMFAASGAHFFARELTVIVRIEPCERSGASRVEFRPRQYAIGI